MQLRVPTLIAALITAAALMMSPSMARADGPDLLTLGAGVFDFNDNETHALGAAEIRLGKQFLYLQPFGGLMVNGHGGGQLYLGVLADIPIGDHFRITPNFAPGFYWEGEGKDLGYPLEFRSGIELAWEFDNRSRVGLAVHHLSNASIADKNPGTETITLFYSHPIEAFFGN